MPISTWLKAVISVFWDDDIIKVPTTSRASAPRIVLFLPTESTQQAAVIEPTTGAVYDIQRYSSLVSSKKGAACAIVPDIIPEVAPLKALYYDWKREAVEEVLR